MGWLTQLAMRHSRRCIWDYQSFIELYRCFEVVWILAKICVAYDLDGQRIDYYPASLEQLKIYEA